MNDRNSSGIGERDVMGANLLCVCVRERERVHTHWKKDRSAVKYFY